MADEPTDAIIPILRQIQETLGEHSGRFDALDERMRRFERRMDEMHESMVTALGMAAHANVRHETVRAQLDLIEQRVARLEQRLES